MRERDRHGRLRHGAIRGAQDFADMLRDPHYAALDEIAAAVYVDRNARGYPPYARAAVKARARPHFRAALEHAKTARTALRRNDLAGYEAERLRAVVELQAAAAQLRQGYIDQYRAGQSPKGKAGAAARWRGRRTRREIKRIIRTLAQRTDALGDPLPASELWGAFYAELDAVNLHPCDTSGSEPTDGDRMQWAGAAMTFKTFRNRISAARR